MILAKQAWLFLISDFPLPLSPDGRAYTQNWIDFLHVTHVHFSAKSHRYLEERGKTYVVYIEINEFEEIHLKITDKYVKQI